VKKRTNYQCQGCGATLSKWAGQCSECEEWNTLVEVAAAPANSRQAGALTSAAPTRVQVLSDINTQEQPRLRTGLNELDRVLGGGLVPGAVILLGGDPGIGKTTLLLQSIAAAPGLNGVDALYVSGEESAPQIALRAERLRVPTADLKLLTETNVDRIIEIAAAMKPGVLVVDSVQTLYTEVMQSPPGSVAQVRECAGRLVSFAKHTGVALYLIGHVTKDGAIAGPRVLEHMVDATLYFEGDPGGQYRLIRAIKNRFGAVNELGVFAMTDSGLREIANPSAILLSRHSDPVPGSVVMVTREGTRPMLVEVQALVDDNQTGQPRRITVGLEQNRLSMLLAILNRHGGISTAGCDVFVNVVGGVRVGETAADLSVALAVVSSLRNRPLSNELIVFGELGLSGEVRPVPGGPERLREASKHGFRRAIVPKGNASKALTKDMDVVVVERLSQALDVVDGMR
jgi:DNA repair protein RadA/Sms